LNLKEIFNMPRLTLFQKKWILQTIVIAGTLTAGSLLLAQQPGPNPSLSTMNHRQVFTAQLNPVNTQADLGAGPISGNARIVIDGDHLGVSLDASGLPPGGPHIQAIYAGTQCPGFNTDQNTDSFIDAVEAGSVTGNPIVPLTLNLLNGRVLPLVSNVDNYPIPSINGQMSYINAIPIATADAALATAPLPPTPNPSNSSEAVSSLPLEPLEGRVIVIHGVDPNIPLPGTVQSVDGLPASATLPLACGQIVRVEE
jgi:hypothetical protein